jgi:hypothetical protein
MKRDSTLSDTTLIVPYYVTFVFCTVHHIVSLKLRARSRSPRSTDVLSQLGVAAIAERFLFRMFAAATIGRTVSSVQ